MQKEGLLSHNPSTLSFHNPEATNQETLQQSVSWMPQDLKIQIMAYIAVSVVQMSVCWYTLHSFGPALATTIDFTTLRSVFLTIFILGYTKLYEPSLSTIDPEHNRLLLGLAFLSLIANMSNYFAFTVLPISQAATYSQMVPALIGMMSYVLIAASDQKIFLIVAGQVLMTFLFEAEPFQLALLLLAPLSLSFMSVLRQVVVKPMNQFTILLFGGLLQIPVLIFLTLMFGNVASLNSPTLLIGSALTSALQLISYMLMNEIIRAQIPTKEVWIISAGCVALTLPVQLIFFHQPLAVMPLVGQTVIVVSSILLD